MKPWFGLHLPRYTFADTPPEGIFGRILEQVRTAEEYGFAQVTVMDHLYQIGPSTTRSSARPQRSGRSVRRCA